MSNLYIVATPIGNLADLPPRAREVLSSVDLVLCEDTRVTQKLLTVLGISAKTRAFHHHTKDAERQRLIAEIKEGVEMAFVSDAGTPGISDPGGQLVASAVEQGIPVIPIPGPSAVATALSVCAFPADAFTFYGFPPHKKGRAKFFEAVAATEHTTVLYESKHRIEKALTELPQDRPMMVARELTKMHETLYRGMAPEILEKIKNSSAKGEFVIVLAPKNWK